MAAKYVVAVRVDIKPGHEQELHEFYRGEHFPSLLSVKGVESVRLFSLVKGEGPKFMVLWEIENPQVPESETYKKAAFTPWRDRVAAHYTSRLRGVFEEIVGFHHSNYQEMSDKYTWVARMDIPPDTEAEFNDWYNKEHVPMLLRVPGWSAARRFRLIQGDGPKYMTIHEIESPQVLEREVRLKTHNTEWAKRIRPQFKNHSHDLYKQDYGLVRY